MKCVPVILMIMTIIIIFQLYFAWSIFSWIKSLFSQQITNDPTALITPVEYKADSRQDIVLEDVTAVN